MYGIIIGIIILIQGIVTLSGSTRGLGKEYRGQSFTDAYRKFSGIFLCSFGGLWIALYLAYYAQLISQGALRYSTFVVLLLYFASFFFGERKFEKIWLASRKKESAEENEGERS